MSTIRDVAREAGVGQGTVSRYLNGVRVKKENSSRIEEAVKKLNFRLNPLARGLKTSITKTIGVIVPNLGDIYNMNIVKNIEQSLYQYGYNIFACGSWGDPMLETQKTAILMGKKVDGFIVYPCSGEVSHLQELLDENIPLVTLDFAIQGLKCDQVMADNINATYKAVEWLINNNHRRIGIISASKDVFTSRERLNGYMRVHEDYSIPMEKELVMTPGYDELSGYQAMRRLMNLKNPPTAVLACNYHTTRGSVKAIYEMGIIVPKQLSFIGFDDLGLSEMVRPPLSIIVQPMEEMGRKAADYLIKRINGDFSGFPAVARLKTEFVLRSSTAGLEV